MSAKILTDISNTTHPNSTVNCRCWDLYVDNSIIGLNIPALNPGAVNTFLHTNNLSQIVWQPFSASNITGGNDYDILTKDPIIGWQSTQQLQNQNLPDPLQVNDIVATNTINTTTLNTNAVFANDLSSVNTSTGTLSTTNIVDTAFSSGTAGQVLQKSNPGNALIWGPAPASYVANGLTAHLPNPSYFFPTARAIIQLAGTVGTSVNYSLASNVVSINNVVSEIINVNFYANVRVSDSSTFFNFYLLVDGVDTVSYRTQYLQAGATNVYTSVNMNARLTVNPGAQIRLECQRAVGAGTMQIDPTGFNPVYAGLLSISQA